MSIRLGSSRADPRGRGPRSVTDSFADPGIVLSAAVPVVLVGGGVAVGVLSTVAPVVPAVAIAGAVAATWYTSVADRPRRVFLVAMASLLAGYAFLGRGLAHVGLAPLYVGEMVLALGAIAFLFGKPAFRVEPVRVLLVTYMAWGALQTVPYIGRYGIDAFRDGVTWAYGFVAIAIAAHARGEDLLAVIRRYRALAPLLCVFIVALVPLPQDMFPPGPGSDVPIVGPKPGDTAVHMAGIAAFILVGLYSGHGAKPRIPESLLWLIWLPPSILQGVINRGGMGAMAMSALAVLFVRVPERWIRPAFVTLTILIALIWVDPTIDLGLNRPVSVGQVIENLTSVVTETEDPALEGTKEFRLRWWGDIVDYTVNGRYFWTGKGFGVNLADDDGFQVYDDHSLRAPHNGHFEILARSGVPGLALWIALNGAWAISTLRAASRARAAGETIWVAVLGWLFVYWAAAMVNASFDPYLQGPQGGFWYWAVMGAGIVVMDLVSRLPATDQSAGVARPAAAGPADPG